MLDFGLGSGRQEHDQNIFVPISGLLLRQSEIQNRKAAPQTKMGWAICNRRRVHHVRGEGRGAAANENPADRIPRWCLPFRYPEAHRGISRRFARAWLRGGKKRCHGVSVGGGKTRSPPCARG